MLRYIAFHSFCMDDLYVAVEVRPVRMFLILSPSVRIFPEFRACFLPRVTCMFIPLSSGRVHVSFPWPRACFCPVAACMFLSSGRVHVSVQWSRACFCPVVACMFLSSGRVHVSVQWSRACFFSVGCVQVSVRWLRDTVFPVAACGVLVWCALGIRFGSKGAGLRSVSI